MTIIEKKRNAIIDDFHNGIQDPEYEVIPSKTTKGKYTVRKRKPEVAENNEQPREEEVVNNDILQNDEDDEDLEVDDQQQGMFNPMAYFQEYQLQVNKLLIEQMKALRINNKYLHKKQAKYKDRQKKLYNVFSDIANRPETPEREEPKDDVVETIEEEEVNEQPKNVNYFESTYENPIPVKQVEIEKPPPPIEKPVYKNDYEETLDNMAGTRFMPSRRNRIKAFI